VAYVPYSMFGTEKKEDPALSNNGGGSSGSPIRSGSGGPSSPEAARGAGASPTGFTNFERFVEGNKGQIGGMYGTDALKTSASEDVTVAERQARNRIGEYGEPLSGFDVADTFNAGDDAKLQAAIDDKRAGDEWVNNTPGMTYDPTQSKSLQRLKILGSPLTSGTERAKDIHGSYGSGMQKFDEMLFGGTAEGQGAMKDITAKASEVEKRGASAAANVEQAKEAAHLAAEQRKKMVEDNLKGMRQDIIDRATGQATQFNTDESKYSTTRPTGEGEFQYINPAGASTAGNFFTDDDVARFARFNALIGTDSMAKGPEIKHGTWTGKRVVEPFVEPTFNESGQGYGAGNPGGLANTGPDGPPSADAGQMTPEQKAAAEAKKKHEEEAGA
jgi:hypothetical protein